MIARVDRNAKVPTLLGLQTMPRSTPDLPEPEPYRFATSVSHLLHRAEQLASERFTQLAGETITLRQFAVLAAIAEAPGRSQIDLVRATGIDRSTLAEMMNRMEKRGWITRTTSAVDKRAVSVLLSAGGAQILSAQTTHARAADARIMDLLTKAKFKSLVTMLTKLARLAEAQAEKAERAAKRQAKRNARERRAEARGEKPASGKRTSSRKQT
jgi:DNA-binding MarR family transcriptional regulator